MSKQSKLVLKLPKLNAFNLAWPVDWTTLFGAERPLILEIGFGYGHYLRHLSHKRPDASIIGIEIANQCMVAGERLIEREGLDNVRVIHSPANTALHHLFKPGSLSEVHVNFPDPWFKKRHSGRRLMNPLTLNLIVSRLQSDGRFYLATDILAYAEMSAELLAETPGLTNQFDTPYVTDMPGRTRTKYEIKAIHAGRECYYFAYTRNAQPTPIQLDPEERPVPHLIIQSPLNPQTILAQFQPLQAVDTDNAIHVNVGYAYANTDSLLFEAYVSEPTIDQRVAIMLVPREDGAYTLKLGGIGAPRPTDGMHVAVALIGDWIASLHPNAHIVTDKVRR